MKVKLALQREQGSAVDVIAETDATATVADLVRELVQSDPTRSGQPIDPSGMTLAASPPGMNAFRVLEPDQAVDGAQLASGWDARLVRRGSAISGTPASASDGRNLACRRRHRRRP